MQSRGEPAGAFCFDVVTREWEWDDEVYLMHGYDPGQVQPTTQLVTECKDPTDGERLLAVLARCERTAEHFAVSYEHVGGDGRARRLVLVGVGSATAAGEVATVDGHFIDLSAMVEAGHAEERALSEHEELSPHATLEARAVIEQAKGAMMLAYAMDADAAFAMLRWWSRGRNVKVRELARLLVDQVAGVGVSDPGLRRSVDALLHDLTS